MLMPWVHTVSVRTRTGQNALGDVWSSAADVACYISDAAHLVRGAHDEEVVSQTIVYAPTQTASLFTADSIVTVNGRDARVITVNTNVPGRLLANGYVEVHLT